ncbi:hypothetical protein C1Y08_16830 [Pseudomonas sp. FW306-02-F02-AA]|uniref:Uncharacterized protein n=1 Tax=Pseudomonas fluorescens TaxID=294 RepID=A0A0N9WAX1_PSEFL|nr:MULTISPECIES: hypothetical protein [Pseudomonas]ALI04501.1 hypothetical protein AO353_26860 [Pseudomonas fluorescens]PMZ03979.1 hypothetical protein C1Y07_12345 [Pseudomonas sp. FW306-02-F02-AB]PMZ09151.1 hypothetical protein C1Y06_16080 [Pseudomonas sp. FW306-02-H06C]PMZ14864.1 hypothetical protein C1Y08_16830 [Pseudomonas sp. FW306-02-F02-AA]PMZ21408.1 hypothetical protein C1Y09_13205 [Pseudomonas sp. FW306-02-F08-AA]
MTANEKLTSKLTNQQIAEKARDKSRFFSLPNADEKHPAPRIEGMLDDGLLPAKLLDNDLKISVVKLNEYHEGDKARVYLYKSGSEAPVYVGGLIDLPKAETDYPVDLPLPKEYLLDDEELESVTRYYVTLEIVDGRSGNELFTDDLHINIDLHGPYRSKLDGTFIRPPKVIIIDAPDLIDTPWLEKELPLKVKIDTEYQFYSGSDVFSAAISNAEPGADAPLADLVFTGVLAVDGRVDIPLDKFADKVSKDGTIYVNILITDRAGNESKVSFPVSIPVKLQVKPVLHELDMPIVGKNGVLDLKTLQFKIYVYVKHPDHALATDKIRLLLNGTIPVAEKTVGAEPNPMRFLLSYLELKQLAGHRDQPIPTKLSYQLIRGIESPTPSADYPFTFDGSIAGLPHPDYPSLTNPKMINVGLKGESDTLNHIIGTDRGKTVTISTPMSDPLFSIMTDEIAILRYDGIDIYSKGLIGDETELTYDIPAADIDSAGTGIKDACWAIRVNGSANILMSEITKVTVDAAIVEFSEPSAETFPVMDNGVQKYVINCNSVKNSAPPGTPAKDLYQRLAVTIPINKLWMPKDTVVTVHSVGTIDREGHEVIVGTEFSEQYTIQGNEIDDKFVVYVRTYLDKLKPIQPSFASGQDNGAFKCWYTTPVEGTPTSSLVFLREARFLASRVYCEDR